MLWLRMYCRTLTPHCLLPPAGPPLPRVPSDSDPHCLLPPAGPPLPHVPSDSDPPLPSPTCRPTSASWWLEFCGKAPGGLLNLGGDGSAGSLRFFRPPTALQGLIYWVCYMWVKGRGGCCVGVAILALFWLVWFLSWGLCPLCPRLRGLVGAKVALSEGFVYEMDSSIVSVDVLWPQCGVCAPTEGVGERAEGQFIYCFSHWAVGIQL
jgi:hypothetical protein